MAGNNEGRLNDVERQELQTLVREAEDITLANARTLAEQYHQSRAPGAKSSG